MAEWVDVKIRELVDEVAGCPVVSERVVQIDIEPLLERIQHEAYLAVKRQRVWDGVGGYVQGR